MNYLNSYIFYQKHFILCNEVFCVININCSFKCKYQKDGKCHLDNVQAQKVTGNSDCIYFSEVPPSCYPLH